MRINHSNIEHEFDIWHISKSLMKRMKTLDKNILMRFCGKPVLATIYGGQRKHAMVTEIC